MIEEQAQVKGVRGGKVLIEVLRLGGCQGCTLSAGCGTGSLGRLLGHRQKPFALANSLNLKTGDKVIVGMPENAYVLAGFLIYLLPLLSLFLFSMVADRLFGSVDGVNVLAAIAGLVCGILMAAKLARQTFFKTLQPHIIRQVW